MCYSLNFHFLLVSGKLSLSIVPLLCKRNGLSHIIIIPTNLYCPFHKQLLLFPAFFLSPFFPLRYSLRWLAFSLLVVVHVSSDSKLQNSPVGVACTYPNFLCFIQHGFWLRFHSLTVHKRSTRYKTNKSIVIVLLHTIQPIQRRGEILVC
jgi:hypothetical protein